MISILIQIHLINEYLTKTSLIDKFKEHEWFKSGYEEKYRQRYLR